MSEQSEARNVLEVADLDVSYGRGRNRFTAVRGASLTLAEGQTIGLVGESGSGKSTLARALAGLIEPSAGTVSYPGAPAKAGARKVQMIFQDPYSSLNPKMRIGQILGEALRTAKASGASTGIAGVNELLEAVSLDPRLARAYPSALSGGQRQRVAIARAICLEPSLIIADEITSALDVSVQGSVLNLVRDMQKKFGLSMLFVSHNLAVVRYVSDYVYVMYAGQVVEHGPTETLIAEPKHPYTRGLLASVLQIGEEPDADAAWVPIGEARSSGDETSRCAFSPRCPVGPAVRGDRALCAEKAPLPAVDADGHGVLCHFPLDAEVLARTAR